MRDSYSEGVANHTDPESCGCSSNDMAEALTGERMGQVLSHEIPIFQGADIVERYRSNIECIVIARYIRTLRG